MTCDIVSRGVLSLTIHVCYSYYVPFAGFITSSISAWRLQLRINLNRLSLAPRNISESTAMSSSPAILEGAACPYRPVPVKTEASASDREET